MLRGNLKLIIGLIMLAIFLVIAIIGPSIAPYGINETAKMEYVTTKQGGTLMAPPFPPSKKHILGTDRWGYDILSLLLYGARFTLFTVLIVSFLRVAMGGLLGFIFVLNKHALDRPKNKAKVNIFSGLPIFIFIYFILYRINLQPVMRPVTLTVIAGILMVLLGVMNVYNVVYGKTIEIKKIYTSLRHSQWAEADGTL